MTANGKRVATGDSVLRAYAKAVKRVEDPSLSAAMVDAGFIIPDGQKRGKRSGFQVFVKVCRYSDELLASDPLSGGLLCESKRSR